MAGFKDLGKLLVGISLVNIPYVFATYFKFIQFDYNFKIFLDSMVFILLVPLKEFSFLWGMIKGKK